MKVKKIVVFVMVTLLTIGMLAACSKDKVSGKWTMVKAEFSGVEQSTSELGMSMVLEFKDGKVSIVTTDAQGKSTTGESEYKVTDNTITITDDDGTSMTATVDGNTMTLTQDKVKFTLEKGEGSKDATATEGPTATGTEGATGTDGPETTAQ